MNVVFHVSSADLDDRRHAIRNVRNLLDDEAVEADTVTLPVNGDMTLLFPDDSPVRSRFDSLFEIGVRCCARWNPLNDCRFDADCLTDGVKMIPLSIGELAA